MPEHTTRADRLDKSRSVMLALMKDAQDEAEKGVMGIRKPVRPKRSLEEDREDLRKSSNSQSQISFKNEKRHHRIIKQVHAPRNLKSMIGRNDSLILDPRKNTASLARMLETLEELSPKRQEDEHGFGVCSMTFSSTGESIGREVAERGLERKSTIVAFDPSSQELVLGKTPVNEFQHLVDEIPYFELE